MADETSILPGVGMNMPTFSGGFGAIGAILNLIQNIQRMKQMADLRNFYMKGWQPAATQALSRLAGDAASRGWSGYPKGLADITAGAYAPYALQYGQAAQSTIGAPAGPVNPFDQFLKSLEAMRSAFPSKPSDTGLQFNSKSTGMGPGGLVIPNSPGIPGVGENMFEGEGLAI